MHHTYSCAYWVLTLMNEFGIIPLFGLHLTMNFKDQRFVLFGRFSMTRELIQGCIRAAGGVVTERLTHHTNYVICGVARSHLNLCHVLPEHHGQKLLHQLRALIEAPLFSTIDTLTLNVHNPSSIPLLSHIHQHAPCPSLSTLRLQNHITLNINRTSQIFRNPLLSQLHTLHIGDIALDRDDTRQKHWTQMSGQSLPPNIHTLNVADMCIDPALGAEAIDTLFTPFLTNTLTRHIHTLKLGMLAHTPGLLDLIEHHRPELDWQF